MKKMDKSAPILYRLSSVIVDRNRAYDEITFHQAARVIADTIGTIYSGIKTEAFQRALINKNILFGIGDFSIIGTDITTSLGGAVFYNTLAISLTDFDEGHRKAVGHPASMIVPVAIIFGEYLKVSKTDILRSVIIGYEIATRFSNARVKESITTYSSGRWGAIGTAATASYLLGLSIEQTMHALSNAAILSPVMLGGSTDVSTGSMSKEGAAWAAQSGLQSTLLSKEEFVGPYLFVDDHDDYDKDILLEGIGESWLINSNYFKPYACCRWLHSAIAAVMEIKKDHDLNIEEITTIEVNIFKRAIDLISNNYPQNPIQAQFHLPYCIAIGILFNEVTPKNFIEANLNNSKVLSLIDKTIIKKDDDYNILFPERLPSRVIISTVNSEHFSKEVISAPWDADNHPSDELLFKKLINQAGDAGTRFWKDYLKWNSKSA